MYSTHPPTVSIHPHYPPTHTIHLPTPCLTHPSTHLRHNHHRSEGLLNDVLHAFANYATSCSTATPSMDDDTNNTAAGTKHTTPHPSSQATRDALLCVAALVLCVCRPSAHHDVLGTQPVLQCIDVLLHDALHCPDAALLQGTQHGACPSSTAAVAVPELLRGAACARDVPPAALEQPVSLVMWGLAGATDPERHAHPALQYRAVLHARGTLEQVAQLHARCMRLLHDGNGHAQEGYVYGWGVDQCLVEPLLDCPKHNTYTYMHFTR